MSTIGPLHKLVSTEKSAKVWDLNIYIDEIAREKKKIEMQSKMQSQPQTFHRTVRICLAIGQCFALIPVKGVHAASASSLQFKWKDIRTMHTLIVICFGFSFAIINLYWLVITSIKFDNIGPLLWFTTNSMTMCEFIRIGRKWPAMMRHWEHIELSNMQTHSVYSLKTNRMILLASIAIPMCLIVDHSMSIVKDYKAATACAHNNASILELYFRQAFPAFYGIFPFSFTSGFFLTLLNFYCTFTWTYSDNFIIVLSLGLVGMFRNFNKHFNQYGGRIISNDDCGKFRMRYNQLVVLLSEVDRALAVIILISFSNNLYYVCVQLFHSVSPTASILRTIYFWYSLFFLIGRTVLVSLCASKIYDESRKPILIIRTIPVEYYKSEAKRFLEQLIHTKAALSGMNFFHITRKFMLSVAGTIVTYELVLIQLHFTFDSEEKKDTC